MTSHPVSASNLDRWLLQLLLLILVSNAITGLGTETPPVLAPGFWAAGVSYGWRRRLAAAAVPGGGQVVECAALRDQPGHRLAAPQCTA